MFIYKLTTEQKQQLPGIAPLKIYFSRLVAENSYEIAFKSISSRSKPNPPNEFKPTLKLNGRLFTTIEGCWNFIKNHSTVIYIDPPENYKIPNYRKNYPIGKIIKLYGSTYQCGGEKNDKYVVPPKIRNGEVDWDAVPEYGTVPMYSEILFTHPLSNVLWRHLTFCGMPHYKFGTTALILKQDLMEFYRVGKTDEPTTIRSYTRPEFIDEDWEDEEEDVTWKLLRQKD